MSAYLDDMPVTPGDKVICKANLAAEWIEVGKSFTVVAFGIIKDEHGNVFTFPSARFELSKRKSNGH